MEEENNVFTGKTQEEAVNNALMELKLTRSEVDVEVLEEGKKKLFGSTKWRVRVTEKKSDAARAAEFVDGLLKIMGVDAASEIVSEGENIQIDIKTENGAKVIGKRGDVLDAIQCIAGAVANIGREEYIKVVVDCQNYRSQREETLISLAHKVEKKAIETGRKVILEPMNPYERRIIHAALLNSTEVKTASEGKEPARYVVVIPNNARPNDRGIRYGERREGKPPFRGNRGGDKKPFRDRRDRGDKNFRGDRKPRQVGAPRSGGKKEIHFGAFLGNSGAGKKEEENVQQSEE